ncbi:MAG: hypothetical protein JXQ90_05550 [Cyclobacteriaceae bacterium]
MNLVKSILNSLLVITLLMSSAGMSLSKHYCLGRLMSVAVNEQADNCTEGMSEEMPCCEDEVDLIKTDDFSGVGKLDLDPPVSYITVAAYLSINSELVLMDVDKTPKINPSPPLPLKNDQSILQVYLI